MQIRGNRFRAVKVYVGRLTVQFPGAMFYSPIVYYHPIADEFSLPTDIDFWREHDLTMICKSDFGIALKEPGWQESVGMCWELEQFASQVKTAINDTLDGEHEVVGQALQKLA